MTAIGMMIIWASYGLGSYGWVLLKGWDVPLGAWFNPVSPYQWPAKGDPPQIPPDIVFPGQSPQSNTGTAASGTNPSKGQTPGPPSTGGGTTHKGTGQRPPRAIGGV